MFDFAWSEIMLIGAVALIAIGPKDMPAAIRTVTGMIKKARRMAAEFQTHVDEMVREAELGDIKQTFNDLRRMDITSALEKAVDPDRSIRNTFEDNPLATPVPAAPVPATLAEAPPTIEAEPAAEPALDAPTPEPAALPPEPEGPQVPAFIPPNLVPKPAAAAAVPEPPSFIPPHQTGA
jgi:sec-independent protein translocase protein TatB